MSGIKPDPQKTARTPTWVGLYARLVCTNPLLMAATTRKPGYSALRKGRVDIKGARYFLTITVHRPVPQNSPGLNAQELESSILYQAQAIEIWNLTSIVVMPDHLHLLVTLTESNLSAAVRSVKGNLTPVLRDNHLKWQPGFYDHRLRPDDKTSGVIRYMWLNPYRAGLCPANEPWNGWWCTAEAQKWLGDPKTGAPPPEWWR